MRTIFRFSSLKAVFVCTFAAFVLAFPGCKPNANGGGSSNVEAPLRSAPPERPELREELIEAIMGDNESRAIELVDQGAPVNSVNRDGVPILFISGGGCLECEGAMPELTRRLLEYGADPQVSVGRGLQAIHWVVRSGAGGRPGARETVELLLAYGADINAETETGIRPIDFVIQLANASSESGDLEGLVTAERWKEFLMARGARPSNPR